MTPDKPAGDALKALELLKMWRELVIEGGVPRYTVLPGAALNMLVGWTDAALREARTPPPPALDEIEAGLQEIVNLIDNGEQYNAQDVARALLTRIKERTTDTPKR